MENYNDHMSEHLYNSEQPQWTEFSGEASLDYFLYGMCLESSLLAGDQTGGREGVLEDTRTGVVNLGAGLGNSQTESVDDQELSRVGEHLSVDRNLILVTSALNKWIVSELCYQFNVSFIHADTLQCCSLHGEIPNWNDHVKPLPSYRDFKTSIFNSF